MFDFKNPKGEIDSDQLIDMYQDLPIAARERFSDQLTKSWDEFQKKYAEDTSSGIEKEVMVVVINYKSIKMKKLYCKLNSNIL